MDDIVFRVCFLDNAAAVNFFVNFSKLFFIINMLSPVFLCCGPFNTFTLKTFFGKQLIYIYLNSTVLFKLSSNPRVEVFSFISSKRYYGLWMWFPEIFKRIKEGKGGCGGNQAHAASNMTIFDNRTCVEKVAQDHDIYFQSFLIALSNLPGNIMTYLLIDRIGRRNLLGL